jgi:hypothetical protein
MIAAVILPRVLLFVFPFVVAVMLAPSAGCRP